MFDFFIGPKGMFTTRQGLSIIYLSGLEEKDPETPSKTENTFNLKDIESYFSVLYND